MRAIRSTWLVWVGCALACPSPETSAEGVGTAAPTTDADTTTSATVSTTGVPTGTVGDDVTGTSSTSTSGGSSSDDGVQFIPEIDGGGPAIECDIWARDCPRGEKCMPWANDGSLSWNATRCSPIARDPAEVGEPCTVVDSPVSGIDDCVIHAMCFDVDPKTNMGTCVGFCSGSRANPTCPEGTRCELHGESVLILCTGYCDPLLQDCNRGDGCYPARSDFACSPDSSGGSGAVGDPCANINACDPGLFCTTTDALPDCASGGCCSSFCDTSDPGASEACDAALPGTECVAWYEPGQAPPGYENVGGCMAP